MPVPQKYRTADYNYTWEQRFDDLLKYREMHGDVLVPSSYTTADGANLGKWVAQQRWKKRRNQLCEDFVARLDDIGFVWGVDLVAYKSRHRYL